MRCPSRRSRCRSRNSKCFGNWAQQHTGYKHSHCHFIISTNSDLRQRRWWIRHDWRSGRWRRRRYPLHRLLERVAHRNRLGDRCRGTSNTGRERHPIRRARSDDGCRRAVGAEPTLRGSSQRIQTDSAASGSRGVGRGATCSRVLWTGRRASRGSRYHSRSGVRSLDDSRVRLSRNHTTPIYPTNCQRIIDAPCRRLISEPLKPTPPTAYEASPPLLRA